jgi:hypothetical protein
MCSKNQLNKARHIIISSDSSFEEKSEAYDLIDKWRNSYEEPLEKNVSFFKKNS